MRAVGKLSGYTWHTEHQVPYSWGTVENVAAWVGYDTTESLNLKVIKSINPKMSLRIVPLTTYMHVINVSLHLILYQYNAIVTFQCVLHFYI